jgi:hypothetical protein
LSSVMSSCHFHVMSAGVSGVMMISSSGAMGGWVGVAVKSVVGEHPRNGSGWSMSDFLRCDEAT